MSSASLVCVFCKNYFGKIKIFNAETLEKSAKCLQIRSKFKLKNCEVVLPSLLCTSDGYHVNCYKNFTAINKKYFNRDKDKNSESVSAENAAEETGNLHPPVTTAPTNADGASTSFQVFNHANCEGQANSLPLDEPSVIPEVKNVCIFCNRKQKKHKGHKQHLRAFELSTLQSFVTQYVNKICDTILLKKIEEITSNLEQVRYHDLCRLSYQNMSRPIPPTTSWHILRGCNKEACEIVYTFVEANIISKKRCVFMSFLNELYKRSILDAGFGEVTASGMKRCKLEDSILEKFRNKVQIIKMNNKKILVPSHGANLNDVAFQTLEQTDALQRAALILREQILQLKPKKLPEKLSANDVIAGECTIPDAMKNFFTTLVGGLTQRRRTSSDCKRKVQSLCYDLINNVTKGKIKTTKHLSLGIALKSLTSSRRVIDILNRYGHCSSYNVIEEIETEITFSSNDRSTICPDGINRSKNLCTGVAFDNFDRFVDTCSGKDTLHDTVGIIFQNTTAEAESLSSFSSSVNQELSESAPETLNVCSIVSESEHCPSNKRRRAFDAIIPDIQPYPKRPKVIDLLIPVNDEMRGSVPRNIGTIKNLDLIYMLSHALKIPNTPMWVGFNSLVLCDDSPKQRISYLTPINMSPTNSSVIYETMIQSQQIAKECGETYMQVTYDLAIAKVAMQIQATEHPKFDNLFIHLGSFHIMMAYFHAVGSFIDGCGLAHVMIESQLLASGSVAGFVSGKHFNRCKRLHPMMALGLQILHFEAFLEASEIDVDPEIYSEVERFASTKFSSSTIFSTELVSLMEKYEIYKTKTLSGDFGKTQQFYMIYINLIQHYLTLSRSVRTGDFELFKSVLPQICNLFFAFNQPNYARWLVKYHDNLIKVNETHPGLENLFEKGCFGVKRTDKDFSRQPVDLAMEQTYNADAARRLTGVLHFTNSISARQRWAKSHAVRSTIISHVYEEIGLKRAQDITADLEKNKIKNNNIRLQSFIKVIRQNLNPFASETKKEFLYNISTGRSAPDQVADFLLNIENIGNNLRNNFISECSENASRFEKPIKRTTILNFPSINKDKKIRIAGKLQEIKMQRDLFGRLLGVSLEQNIDIAKVLSYPLTPVPTALCHLDGSICKTDKSALLKLLEKKVESQAPTYVDIVILDGFFILYLMKDIPKTFGNLSKKILQMVTRFNANRIDIVFDRYFSPSIKKYERDLRGGSEFEYVISGPDQVRPADFMKELKNTKFKIALVKFLIQHWESDEMASFIGNKTVYLNFDLCYQYKCSNNKVTKTVDMLYSCEEHEEADTKIVYHTTKIDYESNVLIRCSDTDVLIILLGNMKNIYKSVNIWMEIGTGNNQRYVDISTLYRNLGEPLASALPGFHSITGCDYNPAFFRKGKSNPWKLLEKSIEYQTAFCNLQATDIDTTTFEIIEKFVCHMYAIKNVESVNEARLEIFSKTYKAKNVAESFHKRFANVDASSLPPCKSELYQQLLRAHYITNLWCNAHLKCPTTLKPQSNGWVEREGRYDFVWFEGDQLPTIVNDIVVQPSTDEEYESGEEIVLSSDEETDEDEELILEEE